MANIVNLYAEAGAGLIGDDAQPAVAFSNQGNGPALSLNFGTTIGLPSVALARFSATGASIPIFEFQANSMVSAVSIVFAASANWAGLSVVRVKFSDGTTYGWIPVLPSATVTAAAI